DLLSQTPMSGEQREYFAVIRDSAQALLRIINDILDLSRIEAGAIGLDASVFDLRELLRDVENLVRPSAHGKGIEWRLACPAAGPFHFRGDAGRLRQVLLNLTGNAVKFTESGFVEIRVSRDVTESGAAHLVFRVADSGIGIAPSQIERIFGKFAQG